MDEERILMLRTFQYIRSTTAFFSQHTAFWPPSADFENVLKFMENETFTLAKTIREMFWKRKRGKKKDHYNPDQVKN